MTTPFCLSDVWSAPFVLRIVAGCWLLCGPVWFGIYCNGFWIVKFLAGVFTLNFALGRWRSWAQSWRKGLILTALLGQVITFVCQWILCSILFWFARGINQFFRLNSEPDSDLTPQLLLPWGSGSLFMGVGLIFIESQTRAVHGIPADFFDTLKRGKHSSD